MGMLVDHTYVSAKGRVEYRRAFPVKLRPVVGRREHKVALGLRGSAGLLSRYEAAAAKYAAMVGQAEKKLRGEYDGLDAPMAAYLAKVFARDWHISEEAGIKAKGAEYAELRRNGWDWKLDEYREARVERDMDAMEEHWGSTARALIEHQGILLDPADSESVLRLCDAINDEVIALSAASRERMGGNVIALPEEPIAPVGADSSLKGKDPLPIMDIFDAYAAAVNMTAGVRADWRRNVERLVAFVGHDDARRLTEDDIFRWREVLLSEITKRGTVRDPVTVKGKYVGAVKAMLGWAVQERKLKVNVAAPVIVRVHKKPKLRERDFKEEEAKAILLATLRPVEGHLAPERALARRWIPWLCAYTGARVNEMGQLRREDIKQIDGYWTVLITPEAGTVKTQEARVVPLHPHLIEQGFVDVVKALGDGHIFYDPEKQRKDSEGNRHFKKVGERLATWVRDEVGLTDKGVSPNHGWRHTFKTRAISAGVEERTADAIQGHAPSTVGRTYGKVNLADKAKAIERMPRFEVEGV